MTEAVRTDFATEDRDEAREFLREGYGSALRILGEREAGWRASLDMVDFGVLRVAEARLPADLQFDVEGGDVLIVNQVLAGTILYEQPDGTTSRFGPGDVAIANHPGARFVCRTHEAVVRAIDVPASLVDEVAATDGEEPSAVRYLSPEALDGGAERWGRVVRVVDDLLADEPPSAERLVLGPLARLLAATALTVFPVEKDDGPRRAGLDGTRPETLRRAISFIEANAAQDMTIGDVGRAAYATPRAVQLAFRRHLDTTPLAYLRKVRLGQAHADLQDAVPGDGRTVARIALDWGFSNPSRFAGYYREAYGEAPSRTLAA